MKSHHSNLEVKLDEATNLRRRRYARSSPSPACVSLTPVRVEMLRHLALLRFLSLPQIAKLCCPSERQSLSEKSARRHMRALFDSGLVDVLPVSRAALAPFDAPNDASLLYGSAPNVYAPTPNGMETLHRAGLIDLPVAGRKKASYGPKNSLFLAHELAVRDVYVWLRTVANSGGHALEAWHDGEEAAIPLGRTSAPLFVRPDAWFVLRLQQLVLVGLVEVDRGTERGDLRWREKFDAYAALFNGGHLSAVTGYVNARVLVVTPSERRRDKLAETVTKSAEAGLASRFWISHSTIFENVSLFSQQWRQQPDLPLKSLI